MCFPGGENASERSRRNSQKKIVNFIAGERIVLHQRGPMDQQKMSAWSKGVYDPSPGNKKISFGQIIAHLREDDQIKGLVGCLPRELHNLKLDLWLISATD